MSRRMKSEGQEFLAKLGCTSADSLSPEQLSQIMEKYDVNGDGRIDKKEFVCFLKDLFALVGQDGMNDEELALLYDEADHDGSGYVDKAEFLNMFNMCSEPSSEGMKFLAKMGVESFETLTHAQMSQIMEKYDVNGDGRIDRKEFISFLRDLFVLVGNDPLPDDELDALYQDADKDGSGYVDRDEFLKLFAIDA